MTFIYNLTWEIVWKMVQFSLSIVWFHLVWEGCLGAWDLIKVVKRGHWHEEEKIMTVKHELITKIKVEIERLIRAKKLKEIEIQNIKRNIRFMRGELNIAKGVNK